LAARHAEWLPGRGPSLVLRALPQDGALPIHRVTSLVLIFLLLKSYWELSLGPAGCLGVSAVIILEGDWSGSFLGGGGLSLVQASVHDLLANVGSAFLSFLYEGSLFRNLLLLLLFSLDSRNVALGGHAHEVLFGNLLALLLEDPVVLVVVVMATLVHEVFEDLAHVVVVGPLLELEVTAVLQVDVHFLGDAPGQ